MLPSRGRTSFVVLGLLAAWGCLTPKQTVHPPDSIAVTWIPTPPHQPSSSERQPTAPVELKTTAVSDVTPEDVAAASLAANDASGALALLERSEQAAKGEHAWFRHGAIRGRAYRRAGQPDKAVAALEPIVSHAAVDRHVPLDTVGFELALARMDWADSGSLDPEQANGQRKQTVSLLARLARHKPLRQLAPMKVLHAKALAAVTDESRSGRFWAAKAVRDLEQVIAEYPNHPQIGEFELERARALERAGKLHEAASELRRIAIVHAGSASAERAWAELSGLAQAHRRRVGARPFTASEQLERAVVARTLRYVDYSRKLLDDLVADRRTPRYLKEAATRARAFTAYKQRDYATCASDLRATWERNRSNPEIRDDYLRCLDRAHQYDEALDVLLQLAKEKQPRKAGPLLWQAIEQGFRGGLYQRTKQLLTQYERRYKGHRSERRWLHAFLAYRLDERDAAIEAFADLGRIPEHHTMARYFRGKILLRSTDSEERMEGGTILRSMVSRDPLSYYGVQARLRLEEAGIGPPVAPTLSPMPDEAFEPSYGEIRRTFDRIVREFGDGLEALVRADRLHSVGYIDEARRELRIAIDEYLHGKSGSGIIGGVRNEDWIVGLAWKGKWKWPRASLDRSMRKRLRDRSVDERLRVGLRALALALDEPHRVAKLSTAAEGSYRGRWHPRAYRSAVEREARLREVDPKHMWALMYTESRFRPHVVSSVGARGAIQIMPWTGRQLVERLDGDGAAFNPDALFDVNENVKLSAYYLSELLQKFHGQAPLAYASYNGGPNNVARWLVAKANAPLELDTFIEEIPFPETYRYTKRVVEVYAAYGLLYEGKFPTLSNEIDPVVEHNIDF